MMHTDGIDVLIVGCGHVAEHGYLPACNALGLSVVGIVETDQVRRAAFTGLVPTAASSDRVPAVAELTSGTGFAINLVPGPRHPEVTRNLLRHGWNVFSEKPAASSRGEWTGLVRMAQEARLALISAPFTHLSPPVLEIRRWLDAGRAGDIRVTLDSVREGPAADGTIEEHRKWFFDQGQGPLWDLGVYGATVMIGLFGTPTSLSTTTATRRTDLTIRDDGESRSVSVAVDSYEIRLSWPGASATLLVGFEPGPRNARNLTVEQGGRAARASTWDYGLTVEYSDAAATDPPGEARKYVHGLRQACELLADRGELAAHQRFVGEVLDLLDRVGQVNDRT